MRLASVSDDDASVELQVVGYQFPEVVASGPRDWDANWLMIRGEVRAADGEAWEFSDPCLTAWEARELVSWLRDAADGRVALMSIPADTGGLLCFTEPNVAFGVAARSKDAVVVRVYFSLESMPPSLNRGESSIWEYFVPLSLVPNSLREAARSWEDALADYPVR